MRVMNLEKDGRLVLMSASLEPKHMAEKVYLCLMPNEQIDFVNILQEGRRPPPPHFQPHNENGPFS